MERAISPIGCSCSVDFHTKFVNAQFSSYICKVSSNFFLSSGKGFPIIFPNPLDFSLSIGKKGDDPVERITIEEIFLTSGDNTSTILPKIMNSGRNASLIYSCACCESSDKDRSKKKQSSTDFKQKIEPPKNFISFIKHILAGGTHALCSIYFKKSPTQKVEGLLIPIGTSQALVYTYSAAQLPLKKLLESHSIPFLRCSKEGKEGKPTTKSAHSLAAKADSILPLKNHQQANNKRLETIRTNAKKGSHEKHLEVLLNESSTILTTNSCEDIILPNSSVFGSKKDIDVEDNLFPDSDHSNLFRSLSTESGSYDALYSNHSRLESEASQLFPALNQQSEMMEVHDDADRYEKLEFYTSATGLDDATNSMIGHSHLARETKNAKFNSFLTHTDSVSAIQCPQFEDSMLEYSKQSQKNELINDEEADENAHYFGLFGRVLVKAQEFVTQSFNILRSRSLSQEKEDQLIQLHGDQIEGRNLKDDLFPSDLIPPPEALVNQSSSHSFETFTENNSSTFEERSSVIDENKHENTSENNQSHSFKENAGDESKTVSTFQDDFENDLQNSDDHENGGLSREEIETFKEFILSSFPKFIEFSNEIQQILFGCLIQRNINVFQAGKLIFGSVEVSIQLENEKKKNKNKKNKKVSTESSSFDCKKWKNSMNEVNSIFKQILKGKLGTNPKIIFCVASFSLIQIFFNFEFGKLLIKENHQQQQQQQLDEKTCSFMENAIQRLSLAIGSPFFQLIELEILFLANPSAVHHHHPHRSSSAAAVHRYDFDESKRNASHILMLFISKSKELFADVLRRNEAVQRILDEYDEKKRLEIISPEKVVLTPDVEKALPHIKLPFAPEQQPNNNPNKLSSLPSSNSLPQQGNSAAAIPLERSTSLPFDTSVSSIVATAGNNNNTSSAAGNHNASNAVSKGLVEKKPRIAGHRMNMGMTRAITITGNPTAQQLKLKPKPAETKTKTTALPAKLPQNSTTAAASLPSFPQPKTKNLTGNKRNFADSSAPPTSSVDQFLLSPTPNKRSKVDSFLDDLKKQTTHGSPVSARLLPFGQESFQSPDKKSSANPRAKKSRSSDKEIRVIEATPMQVYEYPDLNEQLDDSGVLFD